MCTPSSLVLRLLMLVVVMLMLVLPHGAAYDVFLAGPCVPASGECAAIPRVFTAGAKGEGGEAALLSALHNTGTVCSGLKAHARAHMSGRGRGPWVRSTKGTQSSQGMDHSPQRLYKCVWACVCVCVCVCVCADCRLTSPTLLTYFA